MEKIKKTELARRLNERVSLADDLNPKQALDIMLYGWRKHHRFGQTYVNALKRRDWMYITEVMDLSRYVGVDLTKSESAHLS